MNRCRSMTKTRKSDPGFSVSESPVRILLPARLEPLPEIRPKIPGLAWFVWQSRPDRGVFCWNDEDGLSFKNSLQELLYANSENTPAKQQNLEFIHKNLPVLINRQSERRARMKHV